MAKDIKSRDWTAVLYPDSMIVGWQDRIYRQLQVPFEYIIHDRDSVELEEDTNVPRKVHLHIILHWNSPTTYSNALNLVNNSLSALGMRCCNKVEPVRNLRYMHRYLTHDTPDCIKDCKFRYPSSEIVTGNNFDLGAFISLDEYEKLDLYIAIRDFMIQHKINTVMDLEIIVQSGGFTYDCMDCKMILSSILNNRTRYQAIAKEINFKFKKGESE